MGTNYGRGFGPPSVISNMLTEEGPCPVRLRMQMGAEFVGEPLHCNTEKRGFLALIFCKVKQIYIAKQNFFLENFQKFRVKHAIYRFSRRRIR